MGRRETSASPTSSLLTGRASLCTRSLAEDNRLVSAGRAHRGHDSVGTRPPPFIPAGVRQMLGTSKATEPAPPVVFPSRQQNELNVSEKCRSLTVRAEGVFHRRGLGGTAPHGCHGNVGRCPGRTAVCRGPCSTTLRLTPPRTVHSADCWFSSSLDPK